MEGKQPPDDSLRHLQVIPKAAPAPKKQYKAIMKNAHDKRLHTILKRERKAQLVCIL